MTPGADIAVVGAGLVGASLAFGLARRGARVTLLDAGDDRFHASAGNFGLVWVQGKGADAPAYAGLSRRSADAWGDFAGEVAEAADWRGHARLGHTQCGGVRIALGEEEMAEMVGAVHRMHNRPDPTDNGTEILDRAALRRLVPGLGPEAAGGTWNPNDGHVDPLATLTALHAALARHPRVTVLRGKVCEAHATQGGFDLITETGRHHSDRVVLAAGLGSVELAATLGIHAPLRPQRGQIVATERTAPLLRLASHSIRQTSDGTVLIGDSKEDVDFDTGTTPEVARAILTRAVRLFPALARVRVARVWGALRVMSPDGMPIYQTSAAHPGASLVTCHSGVTLAAAHAGEVASAVLDGRLNESYAAFSADRFGAAA